MKFLANKVRYDSLSFVELDTTSGERNCGETNFLGVQVQWIIFCSSEFIVDGFMTL